MTEDARHLKVQPGLYALCGAVYTDPITHDHAFEAPLLQQ